VKFDFVSRVDRDLFDRTRADWEAQIAANPASTSRTTYTAWLDFFDRELNGQANLGDGDGCLCAVVERQSGKAVALLSVVHARAKSDSPYLKMLDLHVQPELNLSDAEPNYDELAWVAAHAIVGCLDLTYAEFPSQQLKLLTAVPLDKEFMGKIATAIFGQGEIAQHYELGRHGNWIVVTKRPGADGTRVEIE